MWTIVCLSWLQTKNHLPPTSCIIWLFGNAAISSILLFFLSKFLCLACPYLRQNYLESVVSMNRIERNSEVPGQMARNLVRKFHIPRSWKFKKKMKNCHFLSSNFTAALMDVEICRIIPYLSQKIMKRLRIVYQRLILILKKWLDFTGEKWKLELGLELENIVLALLFVNVKSWTEFCLCVL